MRILSFMLTSCVCFVFDAWPICHMDHIVCGSINTSHFTSSHICIREEEYAKAFCLLRYFDKGGVLMVHLCLTIVPTVHIHSCIVHSA